MFVATGKVVTYVFVKTDLPRDDRTRLPFMGQPAAIPETQALRPLSAERPDAVPSVVLTSSPPQGTWPPSCLFFPSFLFFFISLIFFSICVRSYAVISAGRAHIATPGVARPGRIEASHCGRHLVAEGLCARRR
jgi:hypothetical protein